MGNARKIALIAFIVALLVLGVVVYHLVGASRFLNNVNAAEAHLEDAQTAAVAFDFPSAKRDVSEAGEALRRARSGAAFFSWLKPVPWVGDQVKAVLAILDAGSESLLALEQAVEIAENVYEVVANVQMLLDENRVENDGLSFETLSPEVKAELLRTLHLSLPELQEAQVKLRLAQAELEKLNDLDVSPRITQAIEPFSAILPNLISGVDFLVPFAATVGEIAGVDKDRQWLILFMNDMEMRPGGGFLGVYGLTTVRDGELGDMLVADTYSVDVHVQFDDAYQLPPPAPLRDYVGVDKWYFRDANWSPDFPTASRDAVQLLRQEIAHAGLQVPEIHNVFGLTPTFGSWLLDLTGPITVRGETFTSENFSLKLEYEVEYGFVEDEIPTDQRKEIVGELVDEMVDRLTHLPLTDYPRLFSIIERGFSQKHIGLYSADEKTQRSFDDFGWAGELDVSGADDVLLVVDANLAALKSDPAVQREIEYEVKKQGNEYVATAKIAYQHNGFFDIFTTRYRTFTRVYAPLGSEFISASGCLLNDKLKNPQLLPGQVTVADDLGMTSFGCFTSIEPGTTGVLSFTYKLPPHVVEAIEGGAYDLRVFKQMGSQNHVLTLDLDFGKKVRAAIPAEDRANFGDDAYTLHTTLDANKQVIVQFE